jgi:hypothetical protein
VGVLQYEEGLRVDWVLTKRDADTSNLWVQ